MAYASPIDTITNITKIVKCSRPHDNIVINEYSYICNRYNVKIGIDFHTDNTMKFTVEGIELDVLNAVINIHELIKISMQIFPKGNSNRIFRNEPIVLSANKNHKIKKNNISMEISPKGNSNRIIRNKHRVLRHNKNPKIKENKNTLKKCAHYENIATLKKCVYHDAEVYG